MLKHIFVIVSKELEPERFAYLNNYFQNNPLNAPITYWEPLYKNRDEHLFNRQKYINLKTGEIGLAQTYERLFEHIVKNFNENELFLTLESDVIFTENFPQKLNIILQEFNFLNKENSVVFLGDGCNMHPIPNQQKTEHLYQTNGTKCTDSMLLTYNCVKNLHIFTQNNIINRPIDHIWNDTFKNYDISAYWSEPPIIQQGSQLGIYPSMIK
jgi:GR25 family glycosyltransferase involved in LPS biosynthesis